MNPVLRRLEQFFQDVRYGFRTLRASPGFTAVAILSLALGIGANTTIYSVVNELLLNDVTAIDQDRLVRIGNAQTAFTGISYLNYRDLADSGVFKDLAAEIPMGAWNWRNGAGSERIQVMISSGNLFQMLGVEAALGRTFIAAETDPATNPQVVVLSDGFWRRRLGADRNVLGRVLVMNDRPYTVLGILGRNYRSVIGLSIVPEAFVPVTPALAGASRKDLEFNMIGRLRPGVTRQQALAELAVQVRRLQQIYPATAKDLSNVSNFVSIGGIGRMAADPVDGWVFLIFFGLLSLTVALVLLIACANVSGLLLARGAARQREVAVRLALGAGRARLISQFLTEGLVLSIAGAALGLLLNVWLTRLLSQVSVPFPIPFEFTFAPDRGLLLYSFVLAAATAPLCALAPAFRASRPNVVAGLKQQQPQFSRRFTLRNALVIGQVAMSLVLLVTAALFLRGTLTLAAANPGFDVEHTSSIDVTPVEGRYRGEQFQTFRKRVLDRLETVSGVASVTSAGYLPLNPEVMGSKIRKDGLPESEARSVNAHPVGPKYFATMGIPVVSGREFDIRDRDRIPAAVIVNETFARRYFPGEDALGKRLVRSGRSDLTLEIVGIVRDSKLRTLGESAQPLLYLNDYSTRLIARTAGRPEAAAGAIRMALGEIDSTAAIEIRTLRERSAIARWPTRIGALLLGCLGALGLFLAVMGLYGVIAYAVARRTSEIGIRMALGASRAGVLWMVLRDGLVVVSIGAAIGIILAGLATRPLAAILPSTLSTHDPATFAGVLALLIATSASAALIPARRASRVDPMTALHYE
jgi:putative ABC transport system permease protein